MIIEAARLSGSNLLSPASRSVLFKSLGLTVLLLAGLWFGLGELFSATAMPWLGSFLPGLPDWAGWAGTIAAIIAGVGLALVLALFIAPVTAAMAGLFLDDIAEVIESRDYPDATPGQAMPLGQSIRQSLGFLLVVGLGNLFALVLLIVPGINLAAFFLVNGYLLGREYFEFAAMRFMSPRDAKRLRARNSTTVFFAGLIIAAFLSVPLLNLLTPMFAAGMMVHLNKMISAKAGAER
ncbi:sulfate transporter family protein [Hoeflea sp. YIM 152468]|uniref:sulfate transporter family protein n=1 Tax=Hoeflea sp. YIM 152468 TaxID=3031759 RepID=UPI0023DA029B|nr:sulfate transporter family protein [Hoeflea sp. YIM 152468]MDF1610238.1 sulfate transporter family protein [Hoeflea sp. YIM 152468]